MNMIYHIISVDDWQAAQAKGTYEPESLVTAGFIHFSEQHQVIAVANFVYPGRDDLLLLVVDPALLQAELRYEPPIPPGEADADLDTADQADLYPHLYGALNLDAVIATPILPRTDEGYVLPYSM